VMLMGRAIYSELEEEIGVSQSLLPAVALLSTHLTYLKSTLTSKNEGILIGLYRRVAGRLGEHVLQRQLLYRGGVTAREGQGILRESEVWVETCYRALGSMGRQRVQSPWERLCSAARVAASEGEQWDAVQRLLSSADNDEEWEESMAEALGGFGGLTREEVARLIRRRQK
jgi:RAD50-interacting protein 1